MNSSSLFDSYLVLSVVTFIYGLAAVLYVISWIFSKETPGKLASYAAVFAVAGNLAGIILRWIESYRLGFGHAPLSNLYESLIFFALILGIIYLVIEYRHENQVLGAFAMPIAFLTMAYASLSVEKEIKPLIPALKSNWLITHVLTCFLGYAAFAVAFGLSIMYLLRQKDRFLVYGNLPIAIGLIFIYFGLFIRDRLWQEAYQLLIGATFVLAVGCIIMYLFEQNYPFLIAAAVAFALGLDIINQYGHPLLIRSFVIPVWLIVIMLGFVFAVGLSILYLFWKVDLLERLPIFSVLDELTHQMVMFGFLFLSAGIITGSIWANSAWGTYWSWDPKETWSLITWFIYAILLHARLMRGWHGRRIAYISISGFMAVLFTYFGVNLLPGLHSYGSQ